MTKEKDTKKGVKKKEKKCTIKKNPWMISTAILVVAVLLMLITGFSSCTGNVISEKEANDEFNNFLDSQQLSDAGIGEVEAMGDNLFASNISIQGETIPLYLTTDGKYLVQGIIPLEQFYEEMESSSQEPTQEEPSQLSEEDLESIADFMDCLDQENVRVYGAEWCGYTQQLVDNLGGQEAISPIYIECTEEEQLCSEENVTGFPTIKINGEKVNIERTFEGFAGATECSAPELSSLESGSSSEASC